MSSLRQSTVPIKYLSLHYTRLCSIRGYVRITIGGWILCLPVSEVGCIGVGIWGTGRKAQTEAGQDWAHAIFLPEDVGTEFRYVRCLSHDTFHALYASSPPFDNIQSYGDCQEVNREYYQNCFIYCQRATSSMGTVNENSSHSPVGPWVCLFVFF